MPFQVDLNTLGVRAADCLLPILRAWHMPRLGDTTWAELRARLRLNHGWQRFAPHFCPHQRLESDFVAIAVVA